MVGGRNIHAFTQLSVAGALRFELHLAVDWGSSIPELGRVVQERVREYLGRMTDLRVEQVEVVVDEIA